MNRRLLLWFSLLTLTILSSPVLGGTSASVEPATPRFASPADPAPPLRIEVRSGHIWLQWVHPQLDNISHYLVERSAEGRDFIIIGGFQESDAGEVLEFEDQMTDRPAWVVYRIKICLRDGGYLYSTSCFFSAASGSGTLKVSLTDQPRVYLLRLPFAQSGTLRLVDTQGRVLQQQVWDGQEQLLPAPHLPSGTYLIQIQAGDFLWQSHLSLY
jgi:hypothetical protein